ncbi:hypothetical protein R3P38DRAFT_2589331 [Favolaschia claudopus]|uniref:Uncharacterized protein n=1 Tax=Favolaschia claudopus TaxID=2862362 RepID=A0AAV9Z1M7_9AGAR
MWEGFQFRDTHFQTIPFPDIPFAKLEPLTNGQDALDEGTYTKLWVYPSLLYRDAYRVGVYAHKPTRSHSSMLRRATDLVMGQLRTQAVVIYCLLPAFKLPCKLQTSIHPSALASSAQLSAPQILYAGYCLNAGQLLASSDPNAGSAIVDALSGRTGKRPARSRWVLSRKKNWSCMRLARNGAVVAVTVGGTVLIHYYA